MTLHGRLPWPTPGELDPERRALYDRIAGGRRAQGPQAFPLTDGEGRLNGPFNAMLVSPGLGAALQELGAAIRYHSSLSARVREIAILEVSRIRACEFEWYAHVRVGRNAGLTEDELAALLGDAPAPTFDRTEMLARAVAREATIKRTLSDALFGEARDALGEQGLMDLITLVGYYDHLALLMSIYRTPLPDGEKPVFAAPAQG
jgi:AhpD family alkylhydroperoxidase